jgi:hypothetical protein
MGELYRHFLIPSEPEYLPERDRVARFFTELTRLEALPQEATYVTLASTGRTRAIGRNPGTGEVYYGPELKIDRYTDLHAAIGLLGDQEATDLWAEGAGPAAIPPFPLYRVNQPDTVWSDAYSFSVRCKLRQKPTHFLHSPFGCKCELKADERVAFENPWNQQLIQTSGWACVRFWIEFGIDDYLMPMITDSLEILEPRLVAVARDVFGLEFSQGCLCNDE